MVIAEMVAESLMVCGFLTSPLPLSRAASTSQAQSTRNPGQPEKVKTPSLSWPRLLESNDLKEGSLFQGSLF